MNFFRSLIVLVVSMLVGRLPVSASEFTPERRETCLKTQFYVRPAWDEAIASLVSRHRKRIKNAHDNEKTVVDISLPLTASVGGLREFNEYLGLLQKNRLHHQYPHIPMEIIVPGQTESKLPQIEGLSPRGGEYLYMWTQVLAGEDCSGDIDWVYFMDFTDVQVILHLVPWPDARKRTEFERIFGYWLEFRPEISNEIFTSPQAKAKLISYYLYHYSVMDSKGARDEWNMIQLLGSQQHAVPHIRQGYKNQWSNTIKPMIKPGYQQNFPLPTPTRSQEESAYPKTNELRN